MGVQGLWTVLAPAARPTQIEALAHKRLAVDASIWIYQFLKAVRDAEGKQLRSSHVVGFFRRICKLLFFGIRPVFVFDGKAPELKRKTLARRRGRREGMREEAGVTAGKLLAVQMRKEAERAEERRKELERKKREEMGLGAGERVEEPVPEDAVYVEELNMSVQERQKKRFKKADQYDLPALDNDFSNMGSSADPRIMSPEELEEYAKLFRGGENINLYDFSKIDFDSPFFMSLPAADRYNILNAARLRSRLRMGLSMEQLSRMFPNRMDFSRFQIERVKERNDLTQRLMNLNGMNDHLLEQRVAGEKGREYVLVKNPDVEGGWVLGVVEGTKEKPIDVEKKKQVVIDEESDEEDEEFEDVPIEGMNRLPKDAYLRQEEEIADAEEQMVQQAMRESRKEQPGWERRTRPPPKPATASKPKPQADNNLFFQDDESDEELFGDSPRHSPAGEPAAEDPDLALAFAMSLAPRSPSPQHQPQATKPAAPRVDNPFEEIDEDEDEFVTAVAQKKDGLWSLKDSSNPSWGGLLPFERLEFGAPQQEPASKAPEKQPSRAAEVLPPWFVPEERDMAKEVQKLAETHDRDYGLYEVPRPVARKEFINLTKDEEIRKPTDVIDLSQEKEKTEEVVVLDSDEDEEMVDWDEVPLEKEMNTTTIAASSKKASPSPARIVFPSTELSTTVPRAKSTAVAPIVLNEPNEKPSPAVLRSPSLSPSAVPAPPAPIILNEPSVPSPPTPSAEKVLSLPERAPELTQTENEELDDAPLDWEASDQEDNAPTKKPVEAEPTDHAENPDADISIKYEEDEELPLEEMAELSFLGNNFKAIEDDYIVDDLTEEQAAKAEEEMQSIEAALKNAAPVSEDDADARAAEYARKVQAELELRALRAQQRKELRDADDVTQQMVEECQELLQLFGLPYITSPQEAEAQCATLLELGLVDGIVTDDSDVFLFGATRVYKNFFSQGKELETFLAADLEKELALNRSRLIDLACLLGSDYTDGIKGIGPITAMEILSEFAHDGELSGFHAWWEKQLFQPSIAPPALTTFKRKFVRSMLHKLDFPPSPFPNPDVVDAYLKPEVDDSTQPFQWGVPSLDLLRDFLMRTVGWGKERTDEVLLPVIREQERRDRQANLTRYFSADGGTGAFAPRVRQLTTSARLLKAVGGLKRKLGETEDDEDDPQEEAGKEAEKETAGPISMRARAAAAKKAKEAEGEEESEEEEPEVRKGKGRGKGKGKTKASASKSAGPKKPRAAGRKAKAK